MERAKQVSESIELGVILALVGGFMDVYSYVGRGGVFANAQTGNILLVGVHISEGNIPLAMHFLLPVLCFSVGIMMSDLVHERFVRRLALAPAHRLGRGSHLARCRPAAP